MGKIGRNDFCHCGSGIKYKYCHLNKKSDLGQPTKETKQMDFAELVQQKNPLQILGLLAVLQLEPENHGKNYRFEQMAREILLQVKENDTRPIATWGTLQVAIENYTEGIANENVTNCAFTENAVFEEGNYTVYPGIHDGYTRILNELTECIFLQRNELDKEFIKEIRDAVGLLLLMSQNVANDAGHIPYQYEKSAQKNIILSQHDKASELIQAMYFSKEYISKICELHQYDIKTIDAFILVPGSSELNDDNPDNNVVNIKPLIEADDSILLYMPTAIVHTLVHFIFATAKKHDCYEELVNLLYARQFNITCRALSVTGWLATDITLQETNLAIREAVFQFDNQKLAYVCYIERSEVYNLSSIDQRSKEVVAYLKSLNTNQNFDIFCLYVTAETSEEFSFLSGQSQSDYQSLATRYSELNTILTDKDTNVLSLWKFAKCYNWTSQQLEIFTLGGILDIYAVYKANNNSLLDSDKINPFGGMLTIVNGGAANFAMDVEKQQNVHAVPIFVNGQFGYAKVSRYRDYVPIYIEREISKNFRIVIEGYKMPIWITNTQTRAYEESWATDTCEAVAFWLYKMHNLLDPYLSDLNLVQFEIEIVADSRIASGKDFEIKLVSSESIKLTHEIVPPVLKIGIPFEFMYSLTLPDNTSDRILMRSVLHGMVLYIQAAGKSTRLSPEIIEQIIEETLRPSQAKMLLFSDVSQNVRMDDRRLPRLRYLDDADISHILDNLKGYLPEGYEIPETISNIASKIKLCDDIVTGLIAQITSKLAVFDGKALLRWLIPFNERCVQIKEFREILLPAKIACFSDEENEGKRLRSKGKNLVTTAHSIRTLIEFVALKIPHGNKWPNLDDTDELLALANQITQWGSLSEAIRTKIDNPKMGLLPSGRIGSEKTMEREAFTPYAIAKNESEIFRFIEDFDTNYVNERKSGPAIETEDSKALDLAFSMEFGISLTTLSKIIGALVQEGFSKGDPCIILEEQQCIEILEKIDNITAEEITTALALLSLLERDSIGTPPIGYSGQDIFPWRYNRSISYLRRPLVKVREEIGIFYYYGYRHLVQFADNLLYLLYTSKLPNPKTPLMKSWLAGISGEKGSPFRKQVKEWFEKKTTFEVVSYEIKMDKDVSDLHLKTDKPYGDIDLLVIDHTRKVIYSIECKNITGGRNVHEMKVEMDDYLGRDGNDKKAKMRKHNDRHNWLLQNKSSLVKFVSDIDSYAIKSLILTADEIPLSYISKDSLPLPVKSFVFLRKKGISYLEE
jgi:hypothetical protein